jgi:hypothetical protein
VIIDELDFEMKPELETKRLMEEIPEFDGPLDELEVADSATVVPEDEEDMGALEEAWGVDCTLMEADEKAPAVDVLSGAGPIEDTAEVDCVIPELEATAPTVEVDCKFAKVDVAASMEEARGVDCSFKEVDAAGSPEEPAGADWGFVEDEVPDSPAKILDEAAKLWDPEEETAGELWAAEDVCVIPRLVEVLPCSVDEVEAAPGAMYKLVELWVADKVDEVWTVWELSAAEELAATEVAEEIATFVDDCASALAEDVWEVEDPLLKLERVDEDGKTHTGGTHLEMLLVAAVLVVTELAGISDDKAPDDGEADCTENDAETGEVRDNPIDVEADPGVGVDDDASSMVEPRICTICVEDAAAVWVLNPELPNDFICDR